MSEGILKLFVKDYKQTDNPAVRSKCAVAAGWVCIACNILLCAAKFVIGVISRSIAIQADAVNNLSDVGSSAGMIFGAKAAAKPADREHPYGHARLEYIVSLAIAFIILMVGVTLAREAIDKIISPESVDYSIAMLIVLIISMLVKLWMGFFTADVGKRIGSSTMSAAAADSISDVAATGAIFISSVLGYFFDINIDGYISLAAALFVLYSGIGIIRDVMGPLLGEAPNKETVDELSTLLLSYDGIIGLHDILIHSYGPGKTIASAHAEVRADCDLLHTHEMIDRAEREVGEKLGMLLTLHHRDGQRKAYSHAGTDCQGNRGHRQRGAFSRFPHGQRGEKHQSYIRYSCAVRHGRGGRGGHKAAHCQGRARYRPHLPLRNNNRPRLYRLHGRLKYVKNYCIIEQKYIRRYCLQWNILSSSLKICSPSPAPRASRARLRIT